MNKNTKFLVKFFMFISSSIGCASFIAAGFNKQKEETNAIHYKSSYSYTFTNDDAIALNKDHENYLHRTYGDIAWSSNGIRKINSGQIVGKNVFSFDSTKGLGVRTGGEDTFTLIESSTPEWHLGSQASWLGNHERATNVRITNFKITLTADEKDTDRGFMNLGSTNYATLYVGKGTYFNNYTSKVYDSLVEDTTTTYTCPSEIVVNSSEYFVFSVYHSTSLGATHGLTVYFKSFSFDYEYDIPCAVFTSESSIQTYTNSNPTKISTTIDHFEFSPVNYKWEILDNPQNSISLSGSTTSSSVLIAPTSNKGRAKVQVTAYTTSETATAIVDVEVRSQDDVFDKTTSLSPGQTVVIATESNQELTQIPGTAGNEGTHNVLASLPFELEYDSNSNTYALKTSDGKYLVPDGNGGLALSESKTNNANWNISFGENGEAQISNAANPELQIVYNQGLDQFVCVSGTNFGNANGFEPIIIKADLEPKLTVSESSITQYVDTFNYNLKATAQYFIGEKTYSWSISNVSPSGSITMSNDGKDNAYINFIKKGSATITITVTDEFGYSRTETVSVTSLIEPVDIFFKNGNTQITSITLWDEGGTPRSITPTVQVVDKNGSTSGLTQTTTLSLVDVNPAGCVTLSNGTITGVKEGSAKLKAVSTAYPTIINYLSITVNYADYVSDSFTYSGKIAGQTLGEPFNPSGLTFTIVKGTSVLTVPASEIVFNDGNPIELGQSEVTATYQGQTIIISPFEVYPNPKPTEKFETVKVTNKDDLKNATATYLVCEELGLVFNGGTQTNSTKTTNYTSGAKTSFIENNDGSYLIRINNRNYLYNNSSFTYYTYNNSSVQSNHQSEFTVEFDENGNAIIKNVYTGNQLIYGINLISSTVQYFEFMSESSIANSTFERLYDIQIYGTFVTKESFVDIAISMPICDATGNIPPSQALWNEAAESFAKMTQENKDLFANTVGDTLGESTISSVVGRYDFIMHKYNSIDNEIYKDYMGRVKSGMIHYRVGFNPLFKQNQSAPFIVAIVILISLIGGVSLLRIKRK